MRKPIISRVYKSILRSVTDFIEEMNAQHVIPELEFHDFESRNDEKDLPRKSLFGIDGFSFDENGGFWIIRMAFALSSYRDTNLHDEIEILDFIQMRFGEGQKVNLLDMTTADVDNELVVTDFEILPMAQSEIRNYRVIGVELKRTGTDG